MWGAEGATQLPVPAAAHLTPADAICGKDQGWHKALGDFGLKNTERRQRL